MQSRAVFTNSWGASNIVGSIWVGAFIFKESVKAVNKRLITHADINSCFEYKFAQITPARLATTNTSINHQISVAAKYLISCLKLEQTADVPVYSAHLDRHAGSLGQAMQIIPAVRLDSRLTSKACKLMYQQELKLLQRHYSTVSLTALESRYNHYMLADNVLIFGPTFGTRKSYLKQIPSYWLDRLELHSTIDDLSFIKHPPTWWRQAFDVPWCSFLNKAEEAKVRALLRRPREIAAIE